jgi:hypothetical protein
MATERQKAIAEYMTVLGPFGRKYIGLDVAVIESVITKYRGRPRRVLAMPKVDSKMFCVEISKRCMGRYCPAEIKLYSKCRAMEYENRTGKPGMGFTEYKKRNGFLETVTNE